MPERQTIEKAHKARRQGKSPSTQAGVFVKKEIDEIRAGKHGARSAKQAIAIGLSEARKAGVKVPPAPGKKAKSASPTKKRAKSSETSSTRAKASLKALRREPTSSVSKENLSAQTREAAKRRGPAKRHASAMKAVRTKKAASARKENRHH